MMGEESCAQTGPTWGRSQDVVKGHALTWELWCPPASYYLGTAFEFTFLKTEEYELQRTGIAEGKLHFK